MTEIIYVVTRTLLVLMALLLVARILGRRTLSELTFYDFVISLIIGNIGSEAITDANFSLWNGLSALLVATIWALSINMLTLKSLPARKLIEAEPLLVMRSGKILENNLKKRYYNINDLLEMLRKQGIFDPVQVEFAVIESDGQLSVLKKQAYQNPTLKDLKLPLQNQTATSTSLGKELIIDGKIIISNLRQAGLTVEQLHSQLQSMGISRLDTIMLAMITPEGKLYVDQQKDV